MGFFADLFKDKTNWSYSELQALWATTYGMAGIDGDVHEKEEDLITNYMNNLPKDNITDWKTFCETAVKIKPETHFATLRGMHSDKKKLALACLYLIADADGKLDPKEQVALNNLQRILDVSFD